MKKLDLRRILRTFQREVQKQGEFALISATNINDTLQNLGKENAGTQLWFFVQNFLTSSGNVSKLLWVRIKHLKIL